MLLTTAVYGIATRLSKPNCRQGMVAAVIDARVARQVL